MKKCFVNFHVPPEPPGDPNYTCELVYPKRPRNHVWWTVVDPSGNCNGTFYTSRAAAQLHVGPFQKAIRVRVQPFPEP